MKRLALVVGRFHALTRGQEAWLASLGRRPVERLVCVMTSADQHGTRRNPLDADTREAMLRPALARAGRPFDVVRLRDVAEDAAWVTHLLEGVRDAVGVSPGPSDATVHTSNSEVARLFAAAGFEVVSEGVRGPTPRELIRRVVDGADWAAEATEATRAVLSRPAVLEALRALYAQTLLTDDGELAQRRNFESYGAQMDASLRQKLDDLVPWLEPGCIVDKGCGTGKLLVELSRRYPDSRLVGVDLSHEFLRRCDENTYAGGDVELCFGNVIERNVPPGSASTVIFSSVMHEVYSYSGYSLQAVDRALASAASELRPGGRLVIRDGVSPGEGTWRLQLRTPASRDIFTRFASEFRHGRGVAFERLSDDTVRLSAHDANEFLCKKDYLEHWHIEVHEEYGAHTLAGWGEALGRAGFEVLHLGAITNPWIVAHRYEGQVALTDDAGRPLPWPATNCVVVGRRPAA